MPLSPSMYVIALRHAAVFMKAGSYVIRPKSSSLTLILRRSVARMVSSLMGTSYVWPVRLSVMVRLLVGKKTPPMQIERVNLSNVASARSDERRGDDGRGLGAKAADAEAFERAAVLAGKLQFAFRPAAFRSDEESCGIREFLSCLFRIGVEDDFGPLALHDFVERLRLFDDGDDRSSRLLHRLENDLSPALSFAAIAFGADFDAIGDERNDRAHSELGRLLQDDVELVEIDDGHRQMDGHPRFAIGRGANDLQHVAGVRRYERCAASIEHFHLFAVAHAHHARVMLFVMAQREGVAGGEVGVDEEAVMH